MAFGGKKATSDTDVHRTVRKLAVSRELEFYPACSRKIKMKINRYA